MSKEITDISMKNVTKKCDMDCSYKFNYLEENSFISIEGGTINSMYRIDKSKEPPVIFNEKKYVPFMVKIIAPSLVMINGSYPPGEIRVQHLLINDKGEIRRDDTLLVIVPFKISEESLASSQVITDIINKIITDITNRQNDPMAPMQMLSITYNLQNVIPVKPFFYFKNTINSRSMNVIVYSEFGAIPLNSSTMENLRKLTRPLSEQQIQMNDLAVLPTKELFFNQKGQDNLFSGLSSYTNQSFSQSSSVPSFGSSVPSFGSSVSSLGSSVPSFGSSVPSSGKMTQEITDISSTSKPSFFSSFGSSGLPSDTTRSAVTTQTIQSTSQPSTSQQINSESKQISPSSSSKTKLDISMKNVTGNCDLKCSYGFKYSESASVAKNNGIMISLTYDSEKVPPVTFNGEKYNVGNIMIVSPSIHTFNGKKLSGEIIITHNPVKGGNSLDVCIPLISSSESSSASKIITDIINKVASNAPASGDSTNLNMIFNLQNIIPRKPFFSYTEETSDTIVFGELEAIPLTLSTLSILQKIIKPYPVDMPIVDLFYNSKGPNAGLQLGDGIYISCKPTGSSKEKIPVEYDKTSTALDASDILQNSIFQLIIFILIGCILFIIIFYLISLFFSYLSSEPITFPFLEKFFS